MKKGGHVAWKFVDFEASVVDFHESFSCHSQIPPGIYLNLWDVSEMTVDICIQLLTNTQT